MTRPAVPRLCQGLVVIPHEQGVVIEGGPSRRLLRGAAAAAVVPRLLLMLDGSRDLEALAAGLALTQAQVRQAIALLGGCGLLEVDGTEPADTAVAAFLSRTVNVTGAQPSGTATAAVLATSAVVVIGAPPMAEAIGDDLVATGVGRVETADTDSAVSHELLADVAAAPSRLVVADGADPSFADLVRRCRRLDIPVLRCIAGVDRVELGPLFTASAACVECLGAADSEPSTDLDVAWLLAGLVTAEVLALLSHLTPPETLRSMVRFALPSCARQRFDVTPRPGCPTCGLLASTPAATALAYDWLVTGRPPLRRRRDTERPGMATRLRNEYGTCPWVPVRTHPLSLLLSAVDEIELSTVDIYVLTQPGGLDPRHGGLFRHAGSGELIDLWADAVPLERSLAGVDLGGAPEIAIVCVAALGRRFADEGEGAYRTAHLDTGRLIARLTAVAREQGLAATFASTWDDRMFETLDLLPEYETVTAVVGLHRDGETHAADR